MRSGQVRSNYGSIVLLSLSLGAHPALAGNVDGEVQLPLGGVEEPPPEVMGFINRVRNFRLDPKAYDPRSMCIAFLEPDGAMGMPTPSGSVTWKLGRSAFDKPLLPVYAGVTVEVKSTTEVTHPLYIVGDDKPL